MTSTGSVSVEVQIDEPIKKCNDSLEVLRFGFLELWITKNPFVTINARNIIPESHGIRSDVIRRNIS